MLTLRPYQQAAIDAIYGYFNRGKRAWNHDEPQPPDARPRCPGHLSPTAQKEWRRLAGALHGMGVLTVIDRAALAAYCQAYGRWVEAEEKLRETPALFRTPSGYVQQSPWLGIANKQLELMGRYMTELGMTPASRSRIVADREPVRPMVGSEPITIEIVAADGSRRVGLPPREPQRELTADEWLERHGGEDRR